MTGIKILVMMLIIMLCCALCCNPVLLLCCWCALWWLENANPGDGMFWMAHMSRFCRVVKVFPRPALFSITSVFLDSVCFLYLSVSGSLWFNATLWEEQEKWDFCLVCMSYRRSKDKEVDRAKYRSVYVHLRVHLFANIALKIALFQHKLLIGQHTLHCLQFCNQGRATWRHSTSLYWFRCASQWG